jgi:pyruvate/2-oxoglutarate dehydrogenase complex dihydrolipoamide dehydrogenase (E3) component
LHSFSLPLNLFTEGANIRNMIELSKHYGWTNNGKSLKKFNFNWKMLTQNIENYKKKERKRITTEIEEAGVDFLNGMGKISSQFKVEYKPSPSSGLKDTKMINGNNIIIAAGGEPRRFEVYPNLIKSNHFWLTHDDLLSLNSSPGKTFIYGGHYRGIEIASFLNALGHEVVLATRANFMNSKSIFS